MVLLVPFFQYVIHLSPQTSSNVQLVGYGLVLTLVVLFRPAGALPEGLTVTGLLRRMRRTLSSPGGGKTGKTPVVAADAAERRRARQAARALERVDGAVPAEQGVILDVRNVSKSFGGIKAVPAVDAAADGKVTALIGANGAGKTTVFNLLTGALALNSGQVFLAGEHHRLRPDEVANLGMVVVPGRAVVQRDDRPGQRAAGGARRAW